MSPNRCAVVSFLAAPILPALIGGYMARPGTEPDIVTTVGMAAVAYPFILVVSFLIGAPVLIFFEKRRMASLWALTCAGVVGGVVASPLLRGCPSLNDLLTVGVGGGLTAFLFASLRIICMKAAVTDK